MSQHLVPSQALNLSSSWLWSYNSSQLVIALQNSHSVVCHPLYWASFLFMFPARLQTTTFEQIWSFCWTDKISHHQDTALAVLKFPTFNSCHSLVAGLLSPVFASFSRHWQQPLLWSVFVLIFSSSLPPLSSHFIDRMSTTFGYYKNKQKFSSRLGLVAALIKGMITLPAVGRWSGWLPIGQANWYTWLR